MNQSIIHFYSILSIVFILFLSCSPDIKTLPPIPITISGEIKDDKGYPLPNVSVWVHQDTGISNQSGMFSFDTHIYATMKTVTFQKYGFLIKQLEVPENGTIGEIVLHSNSLADTIESNTAIDYYWGCSGWFGNYQCIDMKWDDTTCVRANDPDRKHYTCSYDTTKGERNRDFASVTWERATSWPPPPPSTVIETKKLVFWAKGEKGNEFLNFYSGYCDDLPNPHIIDSYSAYIEEVTLTTQWKKYEFLLNPKSMSVVYHPFTWRINDKDLVGTKATFYLDGIRFE